MGWDDLKRAAALALPTPAIRGGDWGGRCPLPWDSQAPHVSAACSARSPRVSRS